MTRTPAGPTQPPRGTDAARNKPRVNRSCCRESVRLSLREGGIRSAAAAGERCRRATSTAGRERSAHRRGRRRSTRHHAHWCSTPATGPPEPASHAPPCTPPTATSARSATPQRAEELRRLRPTDHRHRPHECGTAPAAEAVTVPVAPSPIAIGAPNILNYGGQDTATWLRHSAGQDLPRRPDLRHPPGPVREPRHLRLRRPPAHLHQAELSPDDQPAAALPAPPATAVDADRRVWP